MTDLFVYLPTSEAGSGVWTDGYDNQSSDGTCDGFYNVAVGTCEIFVALPSSSNIKTPEPTSTPAPTYPPTRTAPPTKIPSMQPSTTPTLPVPTSNPTGTDTPTRVEDTLCSSEPDLADCIEVNTFSEFKAAIEESNRVVFCGGFKLRKPENENLVISSDSEIRCQKLCTVYGGRGTHMRISGEDPQVHIHNIKYMQSDASAVIIQTSTSRSTTTFCGCQFWK
jgi:hypothetical protein